MTRFTIETFCRNCEDVHAGTPEKCPRCGSADLHSWRTPVATVSFARAIAHERADGRMAAA